MINFFISLVVVIVVFAIIKFTERTPIFPKKRHSKDMPLEKPKNPYDLIIYKKGWSERKINENNIN